MPRSFYLVWRMDLSLTWPASAAGKSAGVSPFARPHRYPDDVPVLSGVVEAAKPYIVAALAASLDRPVLYVVRDTEEVERVTETFSGLIGRDFPVLPYADRDALPYERLMPDADSVQSRMNVLTALTRPAGAMVIICSARALSQPVMPPEEFAQAIVELRDGLPTRSPHPSPASPQPGLRAVPRWRRRARSAIAAASSTFFRPRWRARFVSSSSATRSSRSGPSTPRRSARSIRSTPCWSGPRARHWLCWGRRGAPAGEAGHDRHASRRLRALAARPRESAQQPVLRRYCLLPAVPPRPASLLSYLPASGVLVLHDAGRISRISDELAEQGEEVRDRLERDGENPPGLRPSFIALAGARAGTRPGTLRCISLRSSMTR